MLKRFFLVFLGMIPVCGIAGFLLAAVLTYQMPKIYESETVIQLMPPPEPSGGMGTPVSPRFFATEFERIKSRRLLGQVAEKLGLGERWAGDRDSVVARLKRMVSVENLRGTDLVAVRVRCPNPVDARDIAKKLASVYQEDHAGQLRLASERQLAELDKAIVDQEDWVEERRKVLFTIVKTKGMIHQGEAAPGAGAEVPMNAEKEDREAAIRRGLDAQDYVDAKRELETEEELLKTLKFKRVEEQLRSRVPHESVMIHEEAVISGAPVSPHVTRNLVLGGVVGFLFSPFLALPLALWIHRSATRKAVV